MVDKELKQQIDQRYRESKRNQYQQMKEDITRLTQRVEELEAGVNNNWDMTIQTLVNRVVDIEEG